MDVALVRSRGRSGVTGLDVSSCDLGYVEDVGLGDNNAVCGSGGGDSGSADSSRSGDSGCCSNILLLDGPATPSVLGGGSKSGWARRWCR